MKNLEDFRQEILKERGIKTSGSIQHGVSQEIMEISAERYANYMVRQSIDVLLIEIEKTQYQLTNETGDVTGEYGTDIDTIKGINFDELLNLKDNDGFNF